MNVTLLQRPVFGDWCARLDKDGPWYDDSDPEGMGDTPELAVEDLRNEVRDRLEWCQEALKALGSWHGKELEN